MPPPLTIPPRGPDTTRDTMRRITRYGRSLLAFWHRHGFIRLVFRRAVAAIVLCVGITFVAFTLTELVPADPVAANLGDRVLDSPSIVAAYKAEYGLDKPPPVRYVIYLSHLLRGDLGRSQVTTRPVATDLGQFIPATLELAILAMLIATAIGVPLGLVAAAYRESAIDEMLRVLSLFAISMPAFWVSLIALLIFSFSLGIAPSSGQLSPGATAPPHVTGMYLIDSLLVGDLDTFGDALHHVILPALVLAIGILGVLQRFTRASVLEIINSDYITGARAKGLPAPRILMRYTLRAVLPSIVTVSGLLFASVATGTVLVETVFSWPGVGYYGAHSALILDVNTISGVSLFVAACYVAINFVVDVAHALIDPRVRLG
jgi:peptide/nickel transport system permease protein